MPTTTQQHFVTIWRLVTPKMLWFQYSVDLPRLYWIGVDTPIQTAAFDTPIRVLRFGLPVWGLQVLLSYLFRLFRWSGLAPGFNWFGRTDWIYCSGAFMGILSMCFGCNPFEAFMIAMIGFFVPLDGLLLWFLIIFGQYYLLLNLFFIILKIII
jgi:hypothetical protein